MPMNCPHCHLGVAKPTKGTWAKLVGQHLIVLPDVDVQICDFCGQVDYDKTILDTIAALLQTGRSWGSSQQPQISGQETPERYWGTLPIFNV